MINPDSIPVFILCGGLGTRIKEETELRPKPMIPIGKHPILWHIMRHYRKHGFRKFILCVGYKSHVIKDFFLNYSTLNSDFTIDLKTNQKTIHSAHYDEDWEVTLAYTGEQTMTGARVAIATKKYLGESEHFAVTYGDGLTNADLRSEWEFHLEHKKIGTVLGVNPPSRFGEICLEGSEVVKFQEKPEFKQNWINGGYFFFRREFCSYLSEKEDCFLEMKPLVKLAEDGQLNLYQHSGFWSCMDTQRDRDRLEQLWKTGEAPWAPYLPSVASKQPTHQHRTMTV
ncbi:MAG: Glucose-1-phosphate cytidylyltransferase [Chlamydiae bacterium]|nr:Glucose-1-phosphate cytidylyltransferase [Chlamydiota bacterium]